MATQDAAMPRAAKPAPKPVVRKGKPSAGPVWIITLIAGMIMHIVLCLAVQTAADEMHWSVPFVVGEIRFGEEQFEFNAILALLPFDLFFGFGLAVMIGFMMRLPFFKERVHHTIIAVKKRLMMQLSSTSDEVESIIRNDPENNTRLLARREDINLESVQSEIDAITKAQRYLDGKGGWMNGLGMYMKYHFVEEYANKVQGGAYAGAAFLIVVIGIRGLKFIPAERPSPILFALGIEFVLLLLLAITMIYTEDEERTDRILKQMVDAVKGGKGTKAAAGYDEQAELQLTRGDYERIVREQMDKKILEVMSDKDDDALRRIALDLVSKG
ncbi:MAG TPA: hypothetical protein VFH43_13100 [Candidatus Kapabacteria bacterium]|jgi:hypothetical protein|nr:hypothetical protein [Candidatus Kapabacteria bacterium]